MLQQGRRFLIPKTGDLLIAIGGGISAIPASQSRIIPSSATSTQWAQTKWKFVTIPLGAVFLCITYEVVENSPTYARVTVLWGEELYDIYAGVHALQVIDETNIWLSDTL
ncbi:MAG: hypothetical protein WC761_01955 [Candidatus Paceibacterota bacterium]|jgi:hypothetical protein